MVLNYCLPYKAINSSSYWSQSSPTCLQSLNHGPPHHIRRGRGVSQKSPLVSTPPGLHQTSGPAKIFYHWSNTTRVPPKPHPQMGRHSHGPGNVRFARACHAICRRHWSRQLCGLLNFATNAAIRMTNKVFARNKNYYLFFININIACFHILNNNIGNQFKVSNLANMMGWNSSMSIRTIFEQAPYRS
jgi:hypothetical protein